MYIFQKTPCLTFPPPFFIYDCVILKPPNPLKPTPGPPPPNPPPIPPPPPPPPTHFFFLFFHSPHFSLFCSYLSHLPPPFIPSPNRAGPDIIRIIILRARPTLRPPKGDVDPAPLCSLPRPLWHRVQPAFLRRPAHEHHVPAP